MIDNEIHPDEHLMEITWGEGEPPESVPTYPEGERRCADCGAIIGWALTSHEDGYGREREGLTWTTCFRVKGREVCEDCA